MEQKFLQNGHFSMLLCSKSNNLKNGFWRRRVRRWDIPNSHFRNISACFFFLINSMQKHLTIRNYSGRYHSATWSIKNWALTGKVDGDFANLVKYICSSRNLASSPKDSQEFSPSEAFLGLSQALSEFALLSFYLQEKITSVTFRVDENDGILTNIPGWLSKFCVNFNFCDISLLLCQKTTRSKLTMLQKRKKNCMLLAAWF